MQRHSPTAPKYEIISRDLAPFWAISAGLGADLNEARVNRPARPKIVQREG